jgi:hypothetical protein
MRAGRLGCERHLAVVHAVPRVSDVDRLSRM